MRFKEVEEGSTEIENKNKGNGTQKDEEENADSEIDDSLIAKFNFNSFNKIASAKSPKSQKQNKENNSLSKKPSNPTSLDLSSMADLLELFKKRKNQIQDKSDSRNSSTRPNNKNRKNNIEKNSESIEDAEGVAEKPRKTSQINFKSKAKVKTNSNIASDPDTDSEENSYKGKNILKSINNINTDSEDLMERLEKISLKNLNGENKDATNNLFKKFLSENYSNSNSKNINNSNGINNNSIPKNKNQANKKNLKSLVSSSVDQNSEEDNKNIYNQSAKPNAKSLDSNYNRRINDLEALTQHIRNDNDNSRKNIQGKEPEVSEENKLNRLKKLISDYPNTANSDSKAPHSKNISKANLLEENLSNINLDSLHNLINSSGYKASQKAPNKLKADSGKGTSDIKDDDNQIADGSATKQTIKKTLKNLENEAKTDNTQLEKQKSTDSVLNFSLGDIESQIEMLKNLSIKQ